jgi:outer membrane protein assembly factor BamB
MRQQQLPSGLGNWLLISVLKTEVPEPGFLHSRLGPADGLMLRTLHKMAIRKKRFMEFFLSNIFLLRRDQRAVIRLLVLLITTYVQSQNILTYHNDNARTGQNLRETILTPQNLGSRIFGKLFVIYVDGKVDAEPLYVESLQIPQHGRRNVLYVATERDSVYAFDADTGEQFWQVRLLNKNETPSDNRGCQQVIPEIGITSTPVIDLNRGPHGTIYAVAMSKDQNGRYVQRLHALDLQNGAEEFGGPVEVQAKFPGGGAASRNGIAYFDPKQYEERAALLLVNGEIYTTWTSHCDIDPYNGWVISFNAGTLKGTGVLDLTPNGEEGAIWQSGAGPAADAEGNVYVMDANGTFDTTLNAKGFPAHGDFGNSFVKISKSAGRLAIADYFTMFNVEAENAADEDLGAGGPVVLPDMIDAAGKTRHLAVGIGKDRNIYLVDRNAMGKFSPKGNDGIYQWISEALKGERYRGAPVYFDGRLFAGSVNDSMVEFRFSQARIVAEPTSRTATKFVYPGAMPSLSANGAVNGVVWAVENGKQAVLHAYDANDLSRELYNSMQAPGGRDYFGEGNKFITPLIAHGKVYVGTTNGVGVLGLLRHTRRQLRSESTTGSRK